jgi:putative endonuclease
MPFSYVLYSAKLNKYYIGASTDIESRLYEHNIGHSKFTSTGIPWILKHSEFFETLQDGFSYIVFCFVSALFLR